MVIKLAAMPADAIAAVMSTAHLFIAINMYRLQSLDYTSSKTMVVGNPVTPTAKERGSTPAPNAFKNEHTLASSADWKVNIV